MDPDQVHGRNDLIHDLIGRVTERRVTALLGPRRFGKTSVLRRVAAELSEVTTVWVDLYEVTSIADVAVRFDDALGASTGDFATEARNFAASISINLGLVKVDLTGAPRNRPDPTLTFHGLLDVLVRTASRHSTLLVIDEFSSIGRVDGAAGALRTSLQHNYDELGIVFAGSQPSMMRALFTTRAEPFYGQADIVQIEPLSPADVENIVARGFAETDRDAGRVAGHITSIATGHPQRTMQLADACWRQTQPGATAELDEWTAGLGDVRRAVGDGMERLYSNFNKSERGVLRALARSGTIYGADAEFLALSKGAATHARDSLLDSGDLAETESGLVVVDPMLSDWLRLRFPI